MQESTNRENNDFASPPPPLHVCRPNISLTSCTSVGIILLVICALGRISRLPMFKTKTQCTFQTPNVRNRPQRTFQTPNGQNRTQWTLQTPNVQNQTQWTKIFLFSRSCLVRGSTFLKNIRLTFFFYFIYFKISSQISLLFTQ